MIPRFHIIFFVLLLTAFGCKEKPKQPTATSMKEAKRKLEHVNRVLVDKDKEQIQAYISRHQLLGMEENQSGLYYLVWGEPTGAKVETGDVIILNYKISLLDGTECYNTLNEKPKEFLVGKGGVESGLEMAVLLMHQGQKGKFIMPPHLAYGLLGDSDRIPPLAILVFDVELLTVIES
jgi:FKBP-type peptidyl-prolyl cis-trans isomerase FkpA